MLDPARHPIGGTGVPPEDPMFVEDDFLEYEFMPAVFDLVCSVRVLAEHSPSVVHPQSRSIPRTVRRQFGEWAAAARGVPNVVREPIRRRLLVHGLYAEESFVSEVLSTSGFELESLEPFESDAHLHLLAVTRRP
jgi:hypothetical protein